MKKEDFKKLAVSQHTIELLSDAVGSLVHAQYALQRCKSSEHYRTLLAEARDQIVKADIQLAELIALDVKNITDSSLSADHTQRARILSA